MRSSLLPLLIFVVLAATNPVLPREPNGERPGFGSDTCGAISAIVSLLKLKQAAPFCSSFISIIPFTQTAIIATTRTETVTTSDIVTTTPTVVDDRTFSATVTRTTTTSTSTLTVKVTKVGGTTTEIVPQTATNTVTSTITVPPSEATTTVYTDPPRRRSAAAIEERAVSLPPFLKIFASSAVSRACSCLSLPISTTTKTVSSTTTVTASEGRTSTETDLVTTTRVSTITYTVVESTGAVETETSTVDVTSTVASTSTDTTKVTLTITATASQATVTLPYPSQVVQNPSFETGNSRSAPPWSGFFVGNPFSFIINECDSQLCAYDGRQFVDFVADNPGGITSIQQTLQGVKPGASYTFSCAVGRYNGGVDNPRDSFITVFLDGVVILPEERTCVTDAACSDKGTPYSGWRKITVRNVITNNKSPVLKIQERLIVGTQNQIQDSLLDLVTLTRD